MKSAIALTVLLAAGVLAGCVTDDRHVVGTDQQQRLGQRSPEGPLLLNFRWNRSTVRPTRTVGPPSFLMPSSMPSRRPVRRRLTMP